MSLSIASGRQLEERERQHDEREGQQGAQGVLLASVRQAQDEEASRLLVQVLTFFFSSLLLSSLELSDTKVYEPYIRARLGTAAHFCEVVGNP